MANPKNEKIGKGIDSSNMNESSKENKEVKVNVVKLNSNVLKLIKNLKISISAYVVKDTLIKTIGNKSSFEQSFVIAEKTSVLYSYDKDMMNDDLTEIDSNIKRNSIKWNNKLENGSDELELISSDFANKKGDIFYTCSVISMKNGETEYFSSKRNDIYSNPLHLIESYLRNSLRVYDWNEEKVISWNSNIPMLERKNILEKLYR